MTRQLNLFETQRMQMDDSILHTIASLCEYGPRHPHWAIAYSGGKDSTTVVTLVAELIRQGKVPAPQSLTVMYADTRLELLPLWLCARGIREDLAERGVAVQVVMAPLDKRFLVYVLGRGVPPPNNNTLRWCTRQTKIDPMHHALRDLAVSRGLGRVVERGRTRSFERPVGVAPLLVLTGVRRGESVVRDQRIAVSCAGNNAECGQGWYQRALPTSVCATLAPIDHWRICHVWEWLDLWAPGAEWGDWDTRPLARVYGGRDGDEAAELGTRTGCVGCPLAQDDTATDRIIALPAWSYLAPVKRLRPLWRWLREPAQRLRQPGGEARADGSLVENQHRMGPIKLEARQRALHEVLSIQREVNDAALRCGAAPLDLLNDEEETRIRALIDAGTWPKRWDGSEPGAEEPFEDDGQMLLGLEGV